MGAEGYFMEILRKIENCTQLDGAFLLKGDAADIKLYFLTDEIIRIRASFDREFPEESYVLMTTAWQDRLDPLFEGERKRVEPVEPAVVRMEGRIFYNTGKLQLKVNCDPFELEVEDRSGNILYSTTGLSGFIRDSNRRLVSYARMDEDDVFYGFGEKTGPLNKNKRFIRERATDSFGYDPYRADTLYKHIPFYIKLERESSCAVGVFYHNFHESEFNMGCEKSNYWPRYCYFRADGGDIDMFILGGGKISGIIDNYTLLTGRPALLPKRALGYQGSSMYYAELPKDCDELLLEFIDTMHREDIPIDGFHLSSGYTTVDGKRCVFCWNRDRFKDPAGYFRAMEKAGAPNVPNVKPGVLLTHPEFAEFEKAGAFVKKNCCDATDDGNEYSARVVKDKDACCAEAAIGKWWGGDGAYWDFTDPAARELWKKLLTERLVGLGVDSIWNDNCEYDGILDGDANVSFDGKGGKLRALKPIMATIMCKLSNEAITEHDPDVRPYSVCRAGSSGIQRYAQTWCGDNYTSWESLRGNLPTILGMGLSGQPNEGADIGGFAGQVPGMELFVRWVEQGIFQPRFSIHSASDDNTVTEPWMYPEITDIIRELIKFRYRMSPYLYSLEYEASKTGAPIMRPLVYEFQKDTNVCDIDDEFMFGRDILVAPVMEEGADSRAVYLPKGSCWYDMNNGFLRHEGGQLGPVHADLDSVPMFLREGAIVPFALNQPMNLEKDKVTGLHLYLVPFSEDPCDISTFSLYEDDGVTNSYKKGNYCRTDITMYGYDSVDVDFRTKGDYENPVEDMLVEMVKKDRAPVKVWVKVAESNGTFLVNAGDGNPADVGEDREKDLVNDPAFPGAFEECVSVLPHFLNKSQFDEADRGWYYNMSKRAVLIKYKNPRCNYKLKVSFEARDLLGM